MLFFYTPSYLTLTLFCARDIEDGTLLGKVHKACEDQRCANRYSVFGYAAVKEAFGEAELPTALSESLIFSSSIAPLITEGLKGNPRQVKRFLNAYFLRKELAKVAGLQSIRDDVLVKLMVLEYGHSKQFMDLFEWQAKQEGRSSELQQLEAVLAPPDGNVDNEEEAKKIDSQWSSSFMRRWIAMEPLLSEIDLRDYFWVARDKLSSTLSGVSMIPPLVRTILDDILSSNAGKMRPAVESALKLNADDRILLLNLIEKHIQRNPDQKVGYDALRGLIEKDVVESIESLTRTLFNVPAGAIPPAVGSDLTALNRSKPMLKEHFEPVMNHLRSTETRIGRALRPIEGKR